MIAKLSDITGIIKWKTLNSNPLTEPDYVLDITDVDISSKIGITFDAIAYYSGWPPVIPDGIRNLDRCLKVDGLLIFSQQMCEPLLTLARVYVKIPTEYQTRFNESLVRWIAPHYRLLNTVVDLPRRGINQNVFIKTSNNFMYVCPGE